MGLNQEATADWFASVYIIGGFHVISDRPRWRATSKLQSHSK